MKIQRYGEKRVYAVDKRGNEWVLFKVINLYNNKDQAYSDMMDLLKRRKSENELLEEYKRKDE